MPKSPPLSNSLEPSAGPNASSEFASGLPLTGTPKMLPWK